MYYYWFINYNKYTTQMQDVDNRRNFLRRGDIKYGLSACFLCKPKTVLKLNFIHEKQKADN